jgi:hypothetical protein
MPLPERERGWGEGSDPLLPVWEKGLEDEGSMPLGEIPRVTLPIKKTRTIASLGKSTTGDC